MVGLESSAPLRRCVAAFLGLILTSTSLLAQDLQPSPEELARLAGIRKRVAEEVERLGGRVEIYEHLGQRLIETVDLSRSRVTDPDMGPLCLLLRELPELATLDLSDTKLTDVGLVPVVEIPFSFRLRLARSKLSVAAVACVRRNHQGFVALRPREARYFSDDAARVGFHDHLADWFSENLYAMTEPSLFALSRENPRIVAYRLTMNGLWRPLCVRVIPSGDAAVVYALRLDASSGYSGGRPNDRKVTRLTREEWAELKLRIQEAQFWSLPTDMIVSGIADGVGYLFEGAEGGRYHVVVANHHSSPDDLHRRYYDLCETMIRLSGVDLTRY